MYGSQERATNFRNWRRPLNSLVLLRKIYGMVAHATLAFALAIPAFGQTTGLTSVTLDQAIQMAMQHNHNLLAARTIIQQSQAEEITANLRPDPTLIGDAEYLSPTHLNTDYLSNSSEFDLGLSYLFERGKKRQHRLQAGQDITAQTRSLVADNGRTLSFNVASLFVNVQLAESTLELADLDLKSFGKTVEIGELSYKGRRDQRRRLPENQAPVVAVRDRL